LLNGSALFCILYDVYLEIFSCCLLVTAR